MFRFSCLFVFLFLLVCCIQAKNTYFDNKPVKMAYRRIEIRTDKAPAPLGSYSQAISASNQFSTVYLSGTIPLYVDENGETKLETGSIEKQARVVFTNMKNVAEASGGSLDQVVKVNIFLTNLEDFPIVNQVMGEFFSKPYPARSTVGVSSLLKDVRIEIDGEMRI